MVKHSSATGSHTMLTTNSRRCGGEMVNWDINNDFAAFLPWSADKYAELYDPATHELLVVICHSQISFLHPICLARI